MAKVESFKAVLKTIQPVEKVDVGLVGGPKEARNKAKTLRKRRFQPLVQRLKRARRSFSTRWTLPTASLSSELLSGLDFGCASPCFERLHNPLAPQYARAKQYLARRST